MTDIDIFYERLNNFDKRLEKIEGAIVSISENLKMLSNLDLRITKIEEDIDEAFTMIRDVKKNGTDNCKIHITKDEWYRCRLGEIDQKIKSTNHYLLWVIIIMVGAFITNLISRG